jgi:hypothetical protein
MTFPAIGALTSITSKSSFFIEVPIIRGPHITLRERLLSRVICRPGEDLSRSPGEQSGLHPLRSPQRKLDITSIFH